jgi:hypothetical protein
MDDYSFLLRHKGPSSQAKDDNFDGDQCDRHVERSFALLAQCAIVRWLSHFDIGEAASPALKRVDCLGGVDGIEEGHGDQGCNEVDNRSEVRDGVMDEVLASEL